MDLFLFGALSLLAGGLCSLLLTGPWKTRALLFFSFCSLFLILIPSFIVLFTNRPLFIGRGLFSLRIDAVSAFFQMMIASVFFFSVLYVSGFLKRNGRTADSGRNLFFSALFACSFLLLTAAQNTLQFLVLWQVLVLAFYFSMAVPGKKEKGISRYGVIILFEAGFLFLAAGLLIFSFTTGGWDLGGMKPSLSIPVFLLLIAGFTATSLWPFLTDKSSKDPLVSLFSVFIFAAAFYGLLRTVSWTGASGGLFAAGTLVVLTACIALAGAASALGKKDLASFISFSGPLNFGLAGLAAALGMLGSYYGNTMMSVCGFSAALFQVVNYTIARTLVLCSAGNAIPGGNFPLDRPSGLLRYSPFSGIFFFIGALAMTGLPMLNGLMNFFLSSFGIASVSGKDPVQALLLVVLTVGTILPVLFLFAFFSRIYPAAWLSGKGSKIREPVPGKNAMGWTCVLLLVLVMITGIIPQYIAIFTVNPAADLADTIVSYSDHNVMSVYSRVFNSLNMVSRTLLTFAGLALILYLVRLFVLTKKELQAPARRSGR